MDTKHAKNDTATSSAPTPVVLGNVADQYPSYESDKNPDYMNGIFRNLRSKAIESKVDRVAYIRSCDFAIQADIDCKQYMMLGDIIKNSLMHSGIKSHQEEQRIQQSRKHSASIDDDETYADAKDVYEVFGSNLDALKSRIAQVDIKNDSQIEAICIIVLADPNGTEEYCAMLKDRPVINVNRVFNKLAIRLTQDPVKKHVETNILYAYQAISEYTKLKFSLLGIANVAIVSEVLGDLLKGTASIDESQQMFNLETYREFTGNEYKIDTIQETIESIIRDRLDILLVERYMQSSHLEIDSSSTAVSASTTSPKPSIIDVYKGYQARYNKIRSTYCLDLPPFKESEIYIAITTDANKLFSKILTTTANPVISDQEDIMDQKAIDHKLIDQLADCEELADSFTDAIVKADDSSEHCQGLRVKIFRKLSVSYVRAISKHDRTDILNYIIKYCREQ